MSQFYSEHPSNCKCRRPTHETEPSFVITLSILLEVQRAVLARFISYIPTLIKLAIYAFSAWLISTVFIVTYLISTFNIINQLYKDGFFNFSGLNSRFSKFYQSRTITIDPSLIMSQYRTKLTPSSLATIFNSDTIVLWLKDLCDDFRQTQSQLRPQSQSQSH